MKKNLLIVAAVLFAAVMTGCTVYQTDKANKLVDEANVAIEDANSNLEKGNAKLVEMEKGVPEIGDADDLEKLRAVAKEIIPMLEKARDRYKEGGSKFEEAGKLNLQDKFKEYLDFKGKEMKKRGEIADAMIGEPRSLINTSKREDFDKEVEAVVAKFKSLKSEADDLAAKADKIYEENKQIFRAN